ncbi:hypothetical protein PQ610_02990 [Tardisphaera miroshnichenkoae]
MRIAVMCTDGYVDAPGRAENLCVFEQQAEGFRLVETLPNPALSVERPAGLASGVRLYRGVRAVKAILDKGIDGLVMMHMGNYELKAAQGKVKLYAFQGRAEDALFMIAQGSLREATAPSGNKMGPMGMGRGGGCGDGGREGERNAEGNGGSQ